jgi:hypothetical protein
MEPLPQLARVNMVPGVEDPDAPRVVDIAGLVAPETANGIPSQGRRAGARHYLARKAITSRSPGKDSTLKALPGAPRPLRP